MVTVAGLCVQLTDPRSFPAGLPRDLVPPKFRTLDIGDVAKSSSLAAPREVLLGSLRWPIDLKRLLRLSEIQPFLPLDYHTPWAEAYSCAMTASGSFHKRPQFATHDPIKPSHGESGQNIAPWSVTTTHA